MDSDTEDAMAISLLALGVIVFEENKRRKKRFASRKFLLQRNSHGAFNCIMKELAIEDRQGFRNFVRMSPGEFEELLHMVAPHIKRTDTNFKNAISPAEQLSVTLRFLATGNTYTDLMCLYHISVTKISQIVPHVCSVIIRVLREYVKMPSTEEEWKEISNDFSKEWGFPHCFGAMDGRYIEIIKPPGSGTMYFNYTGTFSIVLLAVVDAHYRFIFVDIGIQGSISDGGVFNHSDLGKKLIRQEIALPKPTRLPGRQKETPFVMVADDAFALSLFLMKPYPGWQQKGSKERIFNYRLSRARRISENAFGILTAVFRCLRTTMSLSPQKAAVVTGAAVHLHNYLRRNEVSARVYSPPGMLDVEDSETGEIVQGRWRQFPQMTPLQRQGRKPSEGAKEVREEFASYFTSDTGRIPWQEKYS